MTKRKIVTSIDLLLCPMSLQRTPFFKKTHVKSTILFNFPVPGGPCVIVRRFESDTQGPRPTDLRSTSKWLDGWHQPAEDCILLSSMPSTKWRIYATSPRSGSWHRQGSLLAFTNSSTWQCWRHMRPVECLVVGKFVSWLVLAYPKQQCTYPILQRQQRDPCDSCHTAYRWRFHFLGCPQTQRSNVIARRVDGYESYWNIHGSSLSLVDFVNPASIR